MGGVKLEISERQLSQGALPMTTTADDVWRLLSELIEAQKETERRFQETERLLREQSQETDRLLREQSQESEQRLQQTRRRTSPHHSHPGQPHDAVIASGQCGDCGY
jgi:paraquat-inducible protein B